MSSIHYFQMWGSPERPPQSSFSTFLFLGCLRKGFVLHRPPSGEFVTLNSPMRFPCLLCLASRCTWMSGSFCYDTVEFSILTLVHTLLWKHRCTEQHARITWHPEWSTPTIYSSGVQIAVCLCLCTWHFLYISPPLISQGYPHKIFTILLGKPNG